MTSSDIPIIQKTYSLILLLQTYLKRAPRFEKFSIWKKLDLCLLDILEILLATSYQSSIERPRMLTKAGIKIDFLRILLRLAMDRKSLDQKGYLELQTQVDEIGRMLGGWLKSLRNNS